MADEERDDFDLAERLRDVRHVPVPRPRTDPHDLINRGRQRQRLARIGTAAGVVAVVGAVSAGAVAIAGAGNVDQELPAASAPTTAAAPSLPGWTPVALVPKPAKVLETWPRGVRPPNTGGTGSSRQHCENPGDSLPQPTGQIRQESEVVPAFDAAVRLVASQAKVERVRPTHWRDLHPKIDGPRGFVELDVTDAAGTGSVQLEVIRFGGTPEQAADADAFAYGNCDRPLRRVLPDGTVLQMYAVEDLDVLSKKAPVQYLRIYVPNGRQYVVTSAGFGSPNYRPIHDRPGGGETIEGGRGSVPLSDQQLARLGEELAKLG